ncbi:MAG: hypothetical protein IPJ28_13840 [Betaproteobacteria bacterium]|nr:hypothetical protein [Betaproteobacteria bacterium]
MILIRIALAAALVALTAAGAWAQAGGTRLPDTTLPETIEAPQVRLYYDPTFTGLSVPPPPQFQAGAKAGSIQATFQVNFLAAGAVQNGNTCVAWTAPAQTAFQFAANIWSSLIQSSVPIVVNACFAPLETGVLGSAGPGNLTRDFPNAPIASSFYAMALANSLAGVDLDTSNPDIRANFSSTFNWYFGTDRNTPAGQVDFVSVVLHELGHGLGFLGSMDVAGGQGSYGLGTAPNVFPIVYDRFTVNGAGQALLNTALFPNPSAALATQLQSNSIFFTATNANAANGGTRVPLYAPPAWNDGSSYSHLAESFNGTANALMTFSLSGNEAIHNPGPVALGMFRDMGWLLNNAPPPGNQTLTVAKAGAGAGTVTSSPVGVNCGATCSALFPFNTVVTLTATPNAGNSFTGWTGNAACAGTGTCTVTMNAAQSVTANFAAGNAGATPRLGNISTRMQVLTGNDVLIGGFIIGGTLPKTVVVRARGPSLVPFGIANALSDPVLQLVSGQTVLATNDDWQDAANAATLQGSGFAPSSVLESAIYTTLAPGAYTAIVTGFQNATGVGIIEVFEVDNPASPLANISTRGQVLTGNDVMIGGFIISGSSPQTVVIRARGPSLIPFGIPNALANPVLQLFSGATQLAMNDNWQSDPSAAAVQAAGFAPASTLEAAMRVTLAPGAYTVIVTGAGGGTGVGIVEVFGQ